MGLVLASTSPYRKSLLERLNIPFSCTSPKADEDELKKQFHGNPSDLPSFLAKKKAESVIKDHPEDIIIGSDQMALFENEALGKPKTTERACQQLEKMSGKEHLLITALCLYQHDQWLQEVNITRLRMRELSPEQIRFYVKKEQPLDCAGSYKVEGLGVSLFSEIQTSDHTAIIGLPLLALCHNLKKLNLDPLSQQKL